MLKKLLSTLALCFASLTLIGSTYAVPPVSPYFRDTETSTTNSFSATTLDFSLTDTANNPLVAPLVNITNMKPGDSQTQTIRIKEDGLAHFKYNITAVQTGGDAAFCSALQVEANIDGGAAEYTGSLTGLTLTPIAISGTEDDWQMTVSLSDNSAGLQNQNCQFNFRVSSWQTDSNGTWGLTDQEEIGNIVTSGSWLPAPHTVTIKLFPIADSRLNEVNPANNSGASNYMRVRSQSGGQNVRAILRFDTSVLPSTATINSCNLNMYAYQTASTSRDHGSYLINSHSNDWGEGNKTGAAADNGEVTWDWYTKPNAWATSGGDYNPTATNTISTGTTTGWKTWNLFGDCNSRNVYSWIIKDTAEGDAAAPRTDYYSKEQTGAAFDPYLEIQFTAPAVSTDHLVINEVYYDVDSSKGIETTNEWVEIYNPTSSSVDISGWKICDGVSCRDIPASSSVPAWGFAVLTPDASTWGFWPAIPGESSKIVLGGSIGEGLNNGGDRVILKDASSVDVDKMSYGTDTSVFTLIDVDEGWSLARLIKGFDTDSASDFWANNNPNPGTNPDWMPMLFVDSEEPNIPNEANDNLEASPTATPTPTLTTTPSPASTNTVESNLESSICSSTTIDEPTSTASPTPSLEAIVTPTPTEIPSQIENPAPTLTPTPTPTPTPTTEPESATLPSEQPESTVTPTPLPKVEVVVTVEPVEAVSPTLTSEPSVISILETVQPTNNKTQQPINEEVMS